MDRQTLELEVLQYARIFPVVISSDGSGPSEIVQGRALSPAELAKIVGRLAAAGHMSPAAVKHFGSRTLTFYEVTDAGRRAARSEAQDLSAADARRLPTRDLRAIWGDHPLAKRQLELRALGAGIIRVALANSTCSEVARNCYLSAFATDTGMLAFVDGRTKAVLPTNFRVHPDVIEALSLPDCPNAGPVGWVHLMS